MKKIKKISFILLIILSATIFYDQSRSYYCLDDGNCITVWKRFGGDCYIIPGKYYGLNQPNGEHLLADNFQYISMFFNEEKPSTIIFRNEGSSQVGGPIKVCNQKKDNVIFVEFSELIKNELYDDHATSFSDVKQNIQYMVLNIFENNAFDKDGRRL